MDCERFRLAISARIDGEDPGVGEGELSRHLAGCAACRAWEASALGVTRGLRLRPAEKIPDLASPIMAAIAAERHRLRPPVTRTDDTGGAPAVIRLTLALIAAAQVVIAIPALTGNDLGAPVHVAHEQGSWGLALAAALAMAAWRPSRAAALAPLLAVFVGCLAALTIGDIVAGRVAPGVELPHLLAGFGLALLWLESHPPAGLATTLRPKPVPRV
ncbi:MAG TPA: zf-HC2 domain-containing protein [Acidimicrobiales bacterium]|jgi:predicted anti-sigma-YlaC factor YlaD